MSSDSQLGGVLLDFDDTLISEGSYFQQVLATYVGVPVSELNYLFDTFKVDRTTRPDLLGFYLDQLGLDRKEHHENLFRHYSEFPARLNPLPGVRDFLHSALDLKLKVCVLTNGIQAIQLHKWSCFNFDRREEIVFVPSRTIGTDKPATETFEYARKLIDLPWAEILVIGDRNTDVTFPASQGAQSFLLDAELAPSESSVRQISSLNELNRIFE